MNRWLVIAPLNAPIGKGKWVFKPEARRFCSYVESLGGETHLLLFDVNAPIADRRYNLMGLAAGRRYEGVAVFCHGWETGLQAGIKRVDWQQLLSREPGTRRVVLYACSAGEGPGPGGEYGYADLVRERLHAANYTATVLAHRTKGHATLNPRWAVFSTEVLDDGGIDLHPNTPEWRKWLKAGQNRFRLALDPFAYDIPPLTRPVLIT